MYGGKQYSSNKINNDIPNYTKIKNNNINKNLLLFEIVLLLSAPIVLPCYLIHKTYNFIISK